MKKIIIIKDEIDEKLNSPIEVFIYDENDYNIIFNIKNEQELVKYLTDKTYFNQELNRNLVYSCQIGLSESQTCKKIENELLSNFNQLLTFVDFVDLTIFDSEIDIASLLEEYPYLNKGNLIVLDNIEIFDEILKKRIEEFNKLSSNCYFIIDGNNTPIKATDIQKTIKIINGYVDYIKSLNLSPLEQIMFAYDIVRERVYNEEKANESYLSSRDLTNVLLGNNIVCQGYANILKSILIQLDIKCGNIISINKSDETRGHARNLVYVNDKKYGVEGIYFLDATWDSKKVGEDQMYPYRYRYFLKTFDEIIKEENYDYKYDMLYPRINESSQIKVLDLKLSSKEDLEIIESVGTLSKLVYNKNILSIINLYPEYRRIYQIDDEKLENDVQFLISLVDNKISAETFIKLYMHIKALEYYINPTKTNLDINYLYRTFIYSKWTFQDFLKKSNHKLLCDILGMEVDPKTIFNEYIIQEKIQRDISRVKLTKTLKNVINTKTMT